MNQKILCIAGAHRSGTSMLTRLLQAAGLELGADEDLMPAGADNPDGFWENLRFVRLNDEVLNASGAAWDLPPLEDETYTGGNFQAARAKAELLIRSFSDSSHWGWKDPRTCLTLPFWQALLPELKTIIIVRNPLEVAYSMNRRNGTSYALGLRLWEIYNRRLLAHTDPKERIITSYQTFFETPETELERIITFAGLQPNETKSIATIVTRDRRHTSFTQEQLIDAGVSPTVIALYESIIGGTNLPPTGSLSAPDYLAGAPNKLNQAIPEAETTRRELASRRGTEIRHNEQIAELTAEKTRAALEIGRRDGRITELQTAYSHLDELLQREQAGRDKLLSEIKSLSRELVVTQQDHAREANESQRLREELASHQANTLKELDQLREELVSHQANASKELDQLREELVSHQANASKELDQLRERFNQTNQLLYSNSIQLSEREAEVTSLIERLRRQLGETKKLIRLLDQTETAADLLRKSRRWIMINPFTWVKAQLTGKQFRGFGHLDKNVEKYHAWRAAHPEIDNLDSSIAALRSRYNLRTQATVTSETSSVPPAQRDYRPEPPAKPITFPDHEKIEVSIIIPVFNQIDFTLACLASIQEHLDQIPIEVVVVDDCSTDPTSETVKQIKGLVYLRSETNCGFIASCNFGASKARGAYLVFLNNDTVVTPNWLAELHETLDSVPKAGLVGSKLVYPDGRLQEAGGIIWRDASGWNRGKFQDPEKPEYNFLREVDYCSAASVMIPKSLFESLGGFDSKYSPAYYEDTDLAFKVRASGRKVLYQPLSKVIHYEGITSGTDISAGAKKYQEVNRNTFATTWDAVLAEKPANGELALWEHLPPGAKRILVIDHHLPMPDRDSGSLRMFQILKILYRLGHRVTFLPDNLADIPPYGDNLRRVGIEVVYHPYINSARSYLEEHGAIFDVVILSRCDFARKHVPDVRRYAPLSYLIFDTVDLHFLRIDREALLTRDAGIEQEARRKEEMELALVDQCDETWLVSEVEAELLRQKRPAKKFSIVSNIVDVPGSATPFSLRRDFLFIGSFQHPPNIDAVIWFTREIYPQVRQSLPGVRFYIIGDKAPPDVIALADENIILTGLQPDVSLYFNSVRLSVAPLRFGAGVKGKINQSMAYGVPVVATSLAVEGMGLTDRTDALIADDPQTFAEALIEVYETEELWGRLSAHGTRVARERYSPEVAQATLARLFQETPETDRRIAGVEVAHNLVHAS
ncbi:MAG: glycosyltransferase [Chthoniobacterales bacterium]|nr:glycosyltransferase [Chthoniobacterales bacterium]